VFLLSILSSFFIPWRVPLTQVKRIALVGVSMAGMGLGSVLVSGGCGSTPTTVTQTEDQNAREQKELVDQAKGNDEAARAARKAHPPQ